MSEIIKPEKKPIIFSGIQPSGTLTLGNYIGALKNFSLLQDDYDCIYCIVDMHAITVRQNPADLRRRCMELAAIYIASGLDPKKSLIYCQSHVTGHAELSWILNCFTYMGELNRMTQYKDKAAKHADNINAGLFTYPVLMAADILLFQTNMVPVGVDQKQHLELCRDVAQRFNGVYGNVFTIPEPYIAKVGSKIMSLQEPTRKMSKSDPDDTFVALLDDPDTIRRKIKRAVTDSDGEIRYDPENKPGVSNLLSIMSALGAGSIESLTAELAGQGYGTLKTRTADCVIAALEPLQNEYKKLIADKGYLQGILDENAKTANYLANKTLRKVQKKVGFASRGLWAAQKKPPFGGFFLCSLSQHILPGMPVGIQCGKAMRKPAFLFAVHQRVSLQKIKQVFVHIRARCLVHQHKLRRQVRDIIPPHNGLGQLPPDVFAGIKQKAVVVGLVEQKLDVVERSGVAVQKLVVQQPFVFTGVETDKLAILCEAHQVAPFFTDGCGIQWAYLALTAELTHLPAFSQYEGKNGRSVRLKGADVDIPVAAQGMTMEQIQGIAAAHRPGEGSTAKKICCLN